MQKKIDHILPGGQWMFAGKGILHSEGPAPELLEKGGVQELIQLWINVPAAHKGDAPTCQSAPKTLQPPVLQQAGVHLRLASGTYEENTGPLNSLTPVISIIGEIEKGRRIQLTATPGYRTLLYVANGEVTINGETISQHHLVVFEKDNDEIILAACENAQILYLSATPIDEPVAAKDNLVMNTKEEIEQA